MASIFSRIIAGEIPCHKIAEDDKYFAFLDISPLAPGHTLIIPKEETDYIFDIDDKTLSGMMLFAKQVAFALKKAVPCKRVGIAVLGLEVPHAHIHLVPLNRESDISFSKPRLELSPEEYEKLSEDIKSHL